MEFDWDEANHAHIARHGVSTRETEEALSDPFAEMIDSEVVGDEFRYRQVGSTASGRKACYRVRGDLIYGS